MDLFYKNLARTLDLKKRSEFQRMGFYRKSKGALENLKICQKMMKCN